MIPTMPALPESPSVAPHGGAQRNGRAETGGGAHHPSASASGGRTAAGRGDFAETLRRMDLAGAPEADSPADLLAEASASDAPARDADTDRETSTDAGEAAGAGLVIAQVEKAAELSAAPSVHGRPADDMAQSARGADAQERPIVSMTGLAAVDAPDGKAASAGESALAPARSSRLSTERSVIAASDGRATPVADAKIDGPALGAGRNDLSSPPDLTERRDEAALQTTGWRAEAGAEDATRLRDIAVQDRLRSSRSNPTDPKTAPTATDVVRAPALPARADATVAPAGAASALPPLGGQSPLQNLGHLAGEDMADRGSTPVAGLELRTGAPQPPGLAAPPRADAPALLRQLAEAVSGAPAPGSVELSLNPPELGRVRLSLAPSESGIAVLVQAERPETLELMRRHADQLAQEFREMGYGTTSFAFGQDTGAPPRKPEDMAGATGASVPEEMTPPAAQDVARRIVLAGLDLRL